jgi:hypothetical protein
MQGCSLLPQPVKDYGGASRRFIAQCNQSHLLVPQAPFPPNEINIHRQWAFMKSFAPRRELFQVLHGMGPGFFSETTPNRRQSDLQDWL